VDTSITNNLTKAKQGSTKVPWFLPIYKILSNKHINKTRPNHSITNIKHNQEYKHNHGIHTTLCISLLYVKKVKLKKSCLQMYRLMIQSLGEISKCKVIFLVQLSTNAARHENTHNTMSLSLLCFKEVFKPVNVSKTKTNGYIFRKTNNEQI